MTQSHLNDLKSIVKKYDGQGGILILLRDDGVIDTHTYGKSKLQCDVIGNWMKSSFDHTVTKIPFSTVFGWGNGGKVQRITLDEWDSLTDSQRAWVLGLGVPFTREYFEFLE